MKLILTQEVSGLGAPGDVVDVAAGYGRNYLIPRGFAMNWTRGAEKQIDLIKRARAAREVRSVEDAQLLQAQLERLQVRMRRRAGNSGRLFGSVGSADIAAAVRGPAAPSSTGAGSRSATRSRPWARTRSGSACTPRSAPPSRSRSPLANHG
jgi:large subunit ribosomal protein L9